MATQAWIELPFDVSSGGTVNSVTASAPLTSSLGINPNISISLADTSTDGYLSSTDWNTFNGKQDPITGNPYSLMFFDSGGLPAALPNFNQNSTTLGLDIALTEEPNNGGGFTAHNWSMAFEPLQNSPAENWNVFNLSVNMDNANSGFTQGTNGNAVQLLNMGYNHSGTGDTGALIAINASNTLGNGTDPVTIKGFGFFAASANVQPNATIDGQIYGFNFNPTLQTGSFTGSNQGLQAFWDGSQIHAAENTHTSFQSQPNIDEINNNANFNGLQSAPTITTLTGNASANGVAFGPTITTTSSTGGVVGLFSNPIITTMGATSYVHGVDIYGVITTSHGNVVGANFSGTINGGDAQYTGVNVAPNGTANLPQVKGLNVDLTQLDSTAQKVGLSINDGALQVISNYDTSILPASPGFASLNQLTGQLTVASGSPMTSTLVFANQLSVNALFNDDMGPDGFGGFVGFTNLGLATQISVQSTKTVDTINSIVSAFSVPSIPGDGGTVSNATMYLAGGVFPGGGNLTVTNLYGFKILPGFNTLATNAWGLYLEETSLNHYVAGQSQFGGSAFSALATNAALKVADGHIQSTQTTAPTTTTDANAGTGATSSVSNATDTAGNLEIACGTTCSSGLQATVVFFNAYDTAPIVVLTPINANAGINAVQWYVNSSTTGFDVLFNVASADSTTYQWSYHVIETA